MMGQWEFQVGVLSPLDVSITCGWPGGCCSASPRISGSMPPSSPSPSWVTGTGPGPTPTSRPRPCARTGAGRHHRRLRGHRQEMDEHIAVYGVGIESRLTGAHETAHFTKFSYGTSDRGASIRIPWAVAKAKKVGSRTVAPTPTWIPTRSPPSSPKLCAARRQKADRRPVPKRD